MRLYWETCPQTTCPTLPFFVLPAVVCLLWLLYLSVCPFKIEDNSLEKLSLGEGYWWVSCSSANRSTSLKKQKKQNKRFLFFILNLSSCTPSVCSHGGFVWRPPRLFVPFNLPGSPRRLLSSLPRHLDTDRFIILFFWDSCPAQWVSCVLSYAPGFIVWQHRLFSSFFLFFPLEKKAPSLAFWGA